MSLNYSIVFAPLTQHCHKSVSQTDSHSFTVVTFVKCMCTSVVHWQTENYEVMFHLAHLHNSPVMKLSYKETDAARTGHSKILFSAAQIKKMMPMCFFVLHIYLGKTALRLKDGDGMWHTK